MTAFYQEKGWYKSKTIWTAIVGFFLSLAGLLGYQVAADAPTIVTGITTVLFALTALFRYQATSEITPVAGAA